MSNGVVCGVPLLCSQACDGFLRFWQCNTRQRQLQQVLALPLDGFINGLASAE